MAKHNRSSKHDSSDDLEEMRLRRRNAAKHSDDLEEMREAYRKHKQGRKGGGGANDWDKLEDGKNNRFILKRPDSPRKFYTEGWTHFNVGPNKRAVRCIDEAAINEDKGLPESATKCPICKKFLREQSRINSEYQKGDEDGREEWKKAKDKYVPRHQFYANVLREDDEGDHEVKILAFGTQVWDGLMNHYLGEDSGIGDFTDPEGGGRWVNIKKVKKGGRDRRNVGYEVYPAGDTTDLSDAWETIQEALHDLDAAVGKILSKDEVIAILKGVDLDKGSDDGDDDDSDDGASNSRSRRKRSRDDEDDDDEEEDEDDVDDDDDEDRPVKKSGSKLAGKMKRRDDD